MTENVTHTMSNVTGVVDNITRFAENVTTSGEQPEIDYAELYAKVIASSYYKTAVLLAYYMIRINLAIGLPGNLLSFVVILRLRPFTSSSYLMCAIEVSDFFYLMVSLFQRYGFDMGTATAYFSCYAGEFLTWFCSYMSLGFVMALTAERGLAVWKPFEVARIMTQKRCVIYSVVLTVVATGLSIIYVFTFEMIDSGNGSLLCVYKPSMQQLANDVWNKINMFAASIIPAFVLLLCSIAIVVGLNKSREMQRLMNSDDQQLQQQARQSRQVTIMLVAVLILFIITSFPWGMLLAFVRVYPSEAGSRKHLRMILLTTLFRNMKDMNHSLNVFCYFLTARRFRVGVLDLLTCGGRLKVKGRTKKARYSKTASASIPSVSAKNSATPASA